MFAGYYLKRTPSGRYHVEEMDLSHFMDRIVIDYQFSSCGDYILNLQGASLLGVFFPKDVDLVEVVNSLWGDYNFTVEIE
jgi:hypothetical protein